MKKLFKKFLFAVLIIIIIFLIRMSGITHYITFEQLKIHRDYLQQLVANHYITVMLSFIGIYIVCEAVALPTAAILTLAGGFLFGTFWGALYTNIGATIGGTIAFLSVRYLIGDYLQQKYKKQLEPINSSMQKYGSNYLLMIHFLALIPFFLVNIAAACTTISVWTFIWTTSVGILPGSLLYSFAGQQLQYLDSPSDVFSWKIVAALSLLVFLVLLPIIIKKLFHRTK